MNTAFLEKATSIRIALGRGVYLRDGTAHRSCAARTLAGLREDSRLFDQLGLVDAVAGTVQGLIGKILRRAPSRKVGELTEDDEQATVRDTSSREAASQEPSEVESATSEASSPADAMAIGVSENAVTFGSVLESDQPQAGTAAGAGDRDSPKAPGKNPPSLLTASRLIPFGKANIRVSARVRRDELTRIRRELCLPAGSDHVFEPAPWAAWRASIHDAPVRPRRGLHLRYVLGDGRGVVYLATPNGPVAWQVIAWEGSPVDTLLQAFSLLSVHASRRLDIGKVQHASVQGSLGEADMERLKDELGIPLTLVAGTGYSPRLVSFGLALGALNNDAEAFNLAESLREAPGLLQRVPWGDVVALSLTFVVMYMAFGYYRDDINQQLATLMNQNAAVTWAAPLTQVQLNQELAFLQRSVVPLKTFVDRRLRFSSGLAAVAGELPANTWLVNVSGEDLAWEKNPNKALGERYMLLQIGAPADRRGDVPPEVNQTVRQLIENEYLGKALSRIKLADVAWQQRGGSGHSVFSILALPGK